MTSRSILAQPITGEIDARGNVIRADEPLRRLHLLAGGIDGGRLAIPALAALVEQSHRLKMRLSRAVRAADDDEDIELWVETVPSGDITRIAILGLHGLGSQHDRENGGVDLAQIDPEPEGEFVLHFDQAMRLIITSGSVPEILGREAFGKNIEAIFDFSTEQKQLLQTTLAAQLSVSEEKVFLAGDATSYQFDAQPRLRLDGSFDGYVVALLPASDEACQTDATTAPTLLFGQQLAPVLRQPLGRIIANAETIGSKLQGPIRENYAAYAKDIADAARHLVALVDDLGDLEALERPNFATARDAIELGDVARRVAGLLALKAADHHIIIHTPPSDEIVNATAEFRRVLQILLNLVTNAIRYSPDGTQIFVTIADMGDAAQICVSDQGGGVAAENRELIFAKFERLGRTGDGGSGLGLYISRRLARFMGGDLTIDDAENGGAKFTLRLPKN